MTLRPEYEGMDDATLVEHLLTRTTVALPDAPRARQDALEDAARVLDGRWLLVGEEYRLAERFSWARNPSSDKEWQIAQHKQYFSPALLQALLATGHPEYLRAWARLLRSWLDQMGTGYITLSDSQVEALRLRNWVEAYLLLRQVSARGLLDDRVVDGALVRRWLDRMGEEARYVAAHLKPVRNHRTFQLWSVVLVGVCFPELTASGELVELGVRELTANLLTDLLDDGVQVEMSTHYHQLVAETAVAFVDLARRNGIALRPELLERVHRALRWSMWLQWPDGDIPLVGDSDDGDHRELLRCGGRLFDDPELLWAATLGGEGRPPRASSAHFEQSGYVVLTDGWGSDPATYRRRTHVLYDAARLGEGAHAHYDLFSFTLHVDGAPAVVDPGRYTYSGEPDADGVDWRHEFKATAAHNTVVVDGRDQTRHVSRNKHGPDVVLDGKRVYLGARGDWVLGSARSTEYRPVHTRLAVFVHRQYLLLVDRITPDDDARHAAEASLHFPEGWEPVLQHGAECSWLHGAPAQVLVWTGGGATARIDPGWVSRAYGVKHRAPVLRSLTEGRGELWLVTAVGPRSAGGRRLELAGLRHLPGSPRAFEVELNVDGERLTDVVWMQDAGFAVPGLAAAGRFALVRHDEGGRVRWLVGENVIEVDFAGVPRLADGVPADVEWSAD